MRRAGGRKLIGQMLIEKGLITEQQLQEALEAQKQSTQLIGEILVDLGYLDKRALYETLSEQLSVPYVDLDTEYIEPKVATALRRDLAERHKAIPIGRGDGTIKVAMAEPLDVIATDDLKRALMVAVEPVLADPEAIERAIEKVFADGGDGGGGAAAAPEMGGPAASSDVEELVGQVRQSGILAAGETDRVESVDAAQVDVANEAPIIRIAKVIIQRAIQERASDIHVEPYMDRVRIRYRIDGVLHDVMQVPKYVHAPLISRLKIMSDMNIAERRVPQDGRIRIRHRGKDYDLRVSSIPTTAGEKIVMRILDKSQVQEMGLEGLGMEPETLAEVERLIRQPNGMILSTGPTGSGKTTTQYAVINRINSVEMNIITIEDPVEYELDGVSQVHVNRKAGVTFAVALKYFLRQDPDVILVGEIRDLETAEIAIQASLTGHLVLSTLHTNDAPSTVTRLVDMGVEPFLISSSVIASLSQRLARTICEECKEPYHPRRDILLGLGFDPDAPENDGVVFYHGVGCEHCRQTGYSGRIGIFELMTMNAEIAELVVKRASANQVREAARAAGMVSLAEDGMKKVLRGQTTVEELTRIVFTAGAYR